MYVLASQWTNTKTRTVAASADLDVLKKRAETKLQKDTGSTRFRWERDEDDEHVPMGTDRLLLLRWSNVTHTWIGSGRYIDTVPLLAGKPSASGTA